MPQIAEAPEDRTRRKSRNRKIVLTFFLFIGVIVLLESPLARVRKMVVTGNTTIPAKRIIADSGVRTGQALWQIEPRRIQSRIAKKEPMVQTAGVSLDWLHGSVLFHITERKIVAVLENAGKFYSLLNDGVVYQSVQASKGLSFPVVTAAKGKLTVGQAFNADVSTLCSEIAKTNTQLLNDVSELHVNGDGTVSLYLDNGFVVVCDATGLQGALNAMQSTVAYFVSHGYKPGTIDLSGAPPYRFTPFHSGSKPSGSGVSTGTGTASKGPNSTGNASSGGGSGNSNQTKGATG